jgi:hypothetical protein
MLRIDELLKNWEDPDIAEYYLACLLGLTKYDTTYDEFRRTKGLYWTKNDVGDSLFEFLERLVALKVLEKDEDSRYRWNSDFDAYWLNPEIKSARSNRD